MNILWIPHAPWREGAIGRDRHLIRHLIRRSHKIATVQWDVRQDFTDLASFNSILSRHRSKIHGAPAYFIRRLPDATRRFRSKPMEGASYNEWLFRRDVSWAIHDFEADIVITAFSCYMTGYPPFDLDVPIVFDYLDYVSWEKNPYKPDLPYLQQTDAVLCVSRLIQERVESFCSSAYYLPNGADVDDLRSADGTEVRRRHGLEEATVVSLIGLNVGSGGLYFLDAVMQAKQEVPSLKCLLVGDSELVRDTAAELDPEGNVFCYVGGVPYEEVFDYYAASDVGLYPAIGKKYDDGRSPIKVFEYSARGTPVVAVPIREVRQLSFDNLVFAEPEANAFAEGIQEAVQQSRVRVPEAEAYAWPSLARQLETILETLIDS